VPQQDSSESNGPDRSTDDKALSPWLEQRFASRARPLAARSPIGAIPSLVPSQITQGHLGDRIENFVSRIADRTGMASAARSATGPATTLNVSESAMTRPAAGRAEPKQGLSLPFLLRHGVPARGAAQLAPAATQGPSFDATDPLSPTAQPTRQAPGLPVSERQHPADRTARGHPPVTEQPHSVTAVDLSVPLQTTGEGPAATHGRAPGADLASRLSGSVGIPRVPIIGQHNRGLQPTEDLDALANFRGSPSQTHDRGIDVATEPRGISRWAADEHDGEPADVGRRPRLPNLRRLASKILTPVVQRAKLQHYLQDTEPDSIEHTSPQARTRLMRPIYRQGEGRMQSRVMLTDGHGVEPSTTGPSASPRFDQTAAPGARILSHPPTAQRPAKPLGSTLRNLQHDLTRRSAGKEHAGVPENPILRSMPVDPDGTISRSPLPAGVPSDTESRPVAHANPPPRETHRGQTPINEAFAKGSMRRPQVQEADLEATADMHAGSTEWPPQASTPHSRVPSADDTTVRSRPIISRMSHAMTRPLQRLLRVGPDLPPAPGGEEVASVGGPDHAQTSPHYAYAHRQPPTLSSVSPRVLRRAESSADNGAEVFRYTSDPTPEISHHGSNTGLDLPVIPVSRAPESAAEPQTTPRDQAEGNGHDKQASPDIRALAREVYPLIKRMILIERDRHPTWY